MIQTFGCIDDAHIPLKIPSLNSQDYTNYKQFYSINVQAILICDSRGLFMDIDCHWPGSVHDAKVFANSNINEKLKNGLLPTFSCPVPGQEKKTKLFVRGPCVSINTLLSKGVSVLFIKR